MLKTGGLLVFVCMAMVFVACKKTVPYDEQKQLEIDDAIIAKYLIDSSVTALKHNSGLYYNIIRPGTGDVVASDTTKIKGNYTLKILKAKTVLEKKLDSTFVFTLEGYMPGWRTGVRLIRPGGAIRLIIPSTLAYQQRSVQSPKIPPNSILDITLEIVSVNKKSK